MADQILSGVGNRYGVFIPNDAATGLPIPAAHAVTPYKGIIVEGVKNLTVTDPEVRRFTHVGDDRGFAQDTLPATELETIQLTVAKSNMTLDGTLDNSKVRQVGTDVQMRVANNDNKGNEVRGTFMAYRQALDTDRTSANFGKKRLYDIKIWPAIQFTRRTNSFEEGITDVQYDGTPTDFTKTPWGEELNSTDWGVNSGGHLDGESLYHPRINSWISNGTVGIFTLSHPPASIDHIKVWAGTVGSVVPVIAVNTVTPSVTIGTVASGLPIIAFIQTNSPNFDAYGTVMAEFIWKDTIKVVTREWTRGELLEFWGRVVAGGDLNALLDSGTRIDEAVLREYVAAQSTAEVYIQNGKGWKRVTEPTSVEGFTLVVPAAQTMFAVMPVSLVDGWIAAAEQENGDLFSLLNFSRQGVTNGRNGSGTPSASEPSSAS